MIPPYFLRLSTYRLDCDVGVALAYNGEAWVGKTQSTIRAFCLAIFLLIFKRKSLKKKQI
jgi:hypothetical protein